MFPPARHRTSRAGIASPDLAKRPDALGRRKAECGFRLTSIILSDEREAVKVPKVKEK
jgi:hypothetical protein